MLKTIVRWLISLFKSEAEDLVKTSSWTIKLYIYLTIGIGISVALLLLYSIYLLLGALS